MDKMKFHRIVFGVCALMLVVLPGMAAAQSSSTFVVPFDRTGAPGTDTLGNPTGAFDNPCTGEWVDVTGNSTVTIAISAKDNKGEQKTSISVTSKGSGTGWVPKDSTVTIPTDADYSTAILTGSTYAFMENQKATFTVPVLLPSEIFESAFSDKFALKGQGPTDNWVIRAFFRIKITGTGAIQVFIDRMTGDVCKG